MLTERVLPRCSIAVRVESKTAEGMRTVRSADACPFGCSLRDCTRPPSPVTIALIAWDAAIGSDDSRSRFPVVTTARSSVFALEPPAEALAVFPPASDALAE